MSSNNGGGFANPAPAGLVALAVACFTFFALLSGKVGATAIPLLGCWLLGGFIVQLTVAIIELKEGALLGGNVFLFFSAFFMFTGGIEFFVKAYFASVNGTPIDGRMDGWAWLVLWIVLMLWTPAYLKTGPAMLGLLILCLDVACFFVAFMDLGILAKTYSIYAAYFLLFTGCFGIYVGAAIQLNDAFGRTILPMPGPLLK